MECTKCESWKCQRCNTTLDMIRRGAREELAAEILARFDSIVVLHPTFEAWLEYESDGRQYEPEIVLSEDGFNKVVDMIENPPEPNEALKRLMRGEDDG